VSTSGPLERVLARIEEDLSAESAAEFVRLAVDFARSARAGAGGVSPAPADSPPPAIPDRGDADLAAVLTRLRHEVVDGAIRLWHPMYMGHQVAVPLPAAVWTEPLIAMMNQSVAVREMSPSTTRIEAGLIDWLCGLVGWRQSDDARPGGTFTSGGTEAIFSSLLAARNAVRPEWAASGVSGRGAIVCGEHAHYAVRRAASELGIGADGAVSVPSRGYRMDTQALEGVLADLDRTGVQRIAVVATAGSTATGSFDDLRAIADVCDRHGIWLHVDAAHGGSALLSSSPERRARLRGIERARSISWDPHKMMLLPLSAGVVLVRDERSLERAFSQQAPYLFHGGAGRVQDQGVRSFMCSRRVDALKLHVALQRYGTEGLGALYDRLCDTTLELYEMLRRQPDFEALHEPECNILCLRFRGADLDDATLDEVNRRLRMAYNDSGIGWITTTVLEGRRVLRAVLMNPLSDASHLQRMLDALRGLARRGDASDEA